MSLLQHTLPPRAQKRNGFYLGGPAGTSSMTPFQAGSAFVTPDSSHVRT